MAELKVMDEYVGPGEKKTAERLAAELPASWVIYAGRKLAGPDKDDVDLIVVGQSLVFTLEEKAWGPTIVVGDNYWTVKGEHRHSPGAQVATVAKKLAGLLRKGAKGYDALKGKRVLAAVVLSYDNVHVIAAKNHDYRERIWPLPIAAGELIALDKMESPLGAARPSVIMYLDGLSPAEKRDRIGEYRILSQIPAAGREQAFEARSKTGQRVVLKCYPVEQLKQLGDPMDYLARETKAINRVAEFGRTWAALPPFESPAHGFYVVPVVPPSVGWTLERDTMASKTTRDGGLIGVNDATVVVRNAFEALTDVHDEELTHRALHPRRIWLGKNRLVKFSDFHLARISGEATISPWADFDISEDYRAPEAAADVGLATYQSDIYSLTLALSTWLLGKDATELKRDELRATIAGVYPWADTFLSGLSVDPSERPGASEMAEAIELPPVRPAVTTSPAADDFQVDGLVGGRYQVREELGVGGFARTWKVYDKNLDLPRVLKQFHTLIPEKLRSEFLAAHELNHEKCGRVFDMQLDLDPAYLVSEYVEGQSLRHPGIDRSIQEVRTIALDILEALDYIHKKGRVHGDVTPSNVIVATDGSGTSKLIDFGLAVPIGEKTEGWSPRFAAPEVMKAGAASPAGDLFGFAATMCYVMLGRAATKYEAGVLRLIAPTDEELATWGEEGSLLLKAFVRGLTDAPNERPSSASGFHELVTSARLIEKPTEAERDRDGELTALERRINPNVTSIRRLYRAAAGGNAGNRGLDDDFANTTYVSTLLDLELLPRVMNSEFEVVLLSGNPGDGKTSVLVKLGALLRTQGASVVYEDAAGWALRLNGHTFYAIFDASESHGDLSSDELVRRALDPVLDGESATALVAINDGRMLQFFVDNSSDFEEWWFSLKDQIEGKPYDGSGAVLVDLKRRALASTGSTPGPARRVLDTMTDESLWEICGSCVAQTSCPLLANRNLLANEGAAAFDELMQVSHLRRRRRATFRDVRSAIAWIITGNRTCDDIHAYASNDLNPLYWDNTAAYDLAFSRTSDDYLVGEWADLDPATVAAPAVDRLWRSIKDDSRKAFLNSPQGIARAIYFDVNLVEDDEIEPRDLRVFRYFDEFLRMLNGMGTVAARDRILLGISRLVGAFGYAGNGLAMSSGGGADGAAWAVLHTVPAEQFRLITRTGSSDFIETMADTIVINHETGPALSLTLDTAEVILRAADGEIINDPASEAIRQEIDSFVNQLKRQPSQVAQIVDSSGSVASARIVGTRIELEDAK